MLFGLILCLLVWWIKGLYNFITSPANVSFLFYVLQKWHICSVWGTWCSETAARLLHILGRPEHLSKPFLPLWKAWKRCYYELFSFRAQFFACFFASKEMQVRSIGWRLDDQQGVVLLPGDWQCLWWRLWIISGISKSAILPFFLWIQVMKQNTWTLPYQYSFLTHSHHFNWWTE